VEFSLREFRREDFESLWSIDQRCFPPGIAYPRRELAAYIRRPGSFTIVAEKAAEEPTAIAGFIVAEGSRRSAGHIITIDVLPGCRRGGLGSKLLQAAEDRLRRVQCHAVVLETAVDNASALAFYKRHQYSVVKAVPRYYSNGVDAFVLEKELPGPSLGSRRR
jgi:[ribosomal protein S18]-alanine N-acetyltransferase